MTDQPTCGQGLAENSRLPAKLAEVNDAVAGNLEVHLDALDLDDEDAAREHAVYVKLATAHRKVAAELRALAEEMAGSRDLPMGRHDRAVMSSARAAKAFEALVYLEHELLTLLRERADQHESLLAEMRGAAAGA